MFYRNILKELAVWKESERRKPLIIRGARQTGKTTCVRQFAKNFAHVVELNLEKEVHRALFEKSQDVAEVLQAIELLTKQSLLRPNTLLFLDEIQVSPKALHMLRFLYEEYPKLAVIGTGSLLEAVLAQEHFSFPVGRVTFLYLYPLTFDEFLLATGEEKLRERLMGTTLNVPLGEVIHELATRQFLTYLLVGGMPEVVAQFCSTRRYQELLTLKEGLVQMFEEDVAKYARTSEAKYVRHVLEHAPSVVGDRVTYAKFGDSSYRSREIAGAFGLLEKAMLLQRLYGTPQVVPPASPHVRVPPKLLYIDVGLLLYKLGLRDETLHLPDTNHLFRGGITEQVVGQELMALERRSRIIPSFWYRGAKHATAETDYLFSHRMKLIPIEVKSGKAGRLRSLQQFARERADVPGPQPACVRISHLPLALTTPSWGESGNGAPVRLLSVPFYLTWRLPELLDEVDS